MPATETTEHRLKRLTIRSWRRGMKEVDLILGPFADRDLAAMSPEDLDLYEALLAENDQDLYLWLTGARPAPVRLAGILRRVALAAGAARDDL